jgi:nicotinamide-nucleotide amidase
MHAEVISIGDELTSGQRLDTNSQWLSQRLADLGIRTLFHTTVGDDLEANVRVFREAAQRAEIIVCTGGLGPTADDLTRQALAETLGMELVFDPDAYDHIQKLFARRKREMPERNRIQAMFPRGARVIANPHGTAPGIDVDIHLGATPARLFALPGVPAEMREMWQATVEPALREMLGPRIEVIKHRVIRCFGVGESDLEAMLPDLIKRGSTPTVGITVSQATISLRITALATSAAECDEQIEPTVATIRNCLGKLIFGEEEDELQHAIVRLLAERKQTLATVECGTGGMVADWFSEAAGQCGVYVGGEVVRDNVEPTSECIRRMAENCRMEFGADYALAIGPFPQPELTHEGAPPQVEVALANHGGVLARSTVFAGHPDILKQLTAKRALNYLRLHLLGETL